MATRKSIHYTASGKKFDSVKDIDFKDITKDNIVNYMLALTPEDITSSLVMELFGEFNGKSLIHHYDTFDVPVGGYSYTNKNGKLVSNTSKFTTTFGIWIFNLFLIKYSGLCDILGYINQNINKKAFGKIHQKLLYALMEDKITSEQYKTFITRVDFIMPWETVLSPAQSEKLLACTKEINKMKKKLIKENAEAVANGDPTVAENIEKELLKFAREYLKDDPALDPYLSGAAGSFENNFKNTYIMKGAIRNPDPNANQEYDISTSSYIDGVSKDEYALLANSLAAGPYARSVATQLGGYWEKLIVSATNSVVVDPGTDCGTDKCMEVLLTDDIADSFIYSYVRKNNGDLEELTSETIDKYIGKKIQVRSTLFCKQYAKDGHVCSKCAGTFFERRGNYNAGIACSGIATKLKLTSMKLFHSSIVTTTKLDPMKAFGLNK